MGIPSELCRWVGAFRKLKNIDGFVVPGTGLLNDAYGLRSWGPYNLFKWCLMARLRGCKVFFLSVGAGPIYSRIGRWLVRSALDLADFRSYRDDATKDFLLSIGAAVAGDRVYPDLAFSMEDFLIQRSVIAKRPRPVVGLGLMLYHGKLSADPSRDVTFVAHLEQLVLFVKWLLARNYDVRLLTGELSDRVVTSQLKELLKERLEDYDESRILDEPVNSAEELLTQLAATDFVVATRFHNVLLALLLNKPTIGISFHEKCSALMASMGLQEYCQDIKHLNADKLISQFCQLEENAATLRLMIWQKVEECRKALGEQYNLIFQSF